MIYIHHNVPGVLRKGRGYEEHRRGKSLADEPLVNEILGDHNVDKQMTDSRGDVR